MFSFKNHIQFILVKYYVYHIRHHLCNMIVYNNWNIWQYDYADSILAKCLKLCIDTKWCLWYTDINIYWLKHQETWCIWFPLLDKNHIIIDIQYMYIVVESKIPMQLQNHDASNYKANTPHIFWSWSQNTMQCIPCTSTVILDSTSKILLLLIFLTHWVLNHIKMWSGTITLD